MDPSALDIAFVPFTDAGGCESCKNCSIACFICDYVPYTVDRYMKVTPKYSRRLSDSRLSVDSIRSVTLIVLFFLLS